MAPQPGEPTLLVVVSLCAQRNAAGRLMVSRKFLTGLAAYADLWPGKVIGCMRVSQKADDSLDLTEHVPGSTRFELREAPWNPERLGEVLDGVTVALVLDDAYGRVLARRLTKAGVPYVHVLEWDPQTRRQIMWHDAPSPLRGAKRILMGELSAIARRRSMKGAAGLQCNGTPTFEAYKARTPRPLLYFDSRVTGDMVVREDVLERRLGHLLAEGEARKPLRLVFSGRLIEIKGVRHLPEVAAGLCTLGVDFTMDICGGGVLEEPLKARIAALGLGGRVRMRGTLDFKTKLMPLVTEETDLFVCCHLQGDPSCTYLETMSCGVPIVGYGNSSMRGFAELAPVAWYVPGYRAEALAALIAKLDRDRARIARAAREARAFSLRHTFENTMKMRIQHLLACSGSGAALAAERPGAQAERRTTA